MTDQTAQPDDSFDREVGYNLLAKQRFQTTVLNNLMRALRHGGTCHNCVVDPDEDSRAWCDCSATRDDYVCVTGPCSQLAHDPQECPLILGAHEFEKVGGALPGEVPMAACKAIVAAPELRRAQRYCNRGLVHPVHHPLYRYVAENGDLTGWTPPDESAKLKAVAAEAGHYQRCPQCRHMPHAKLGFCPNMASDNDCACTYEGEPEYAKSMTVASADQSADQEPAKDSVAVKGREVLQPLHEVLDAWLADLTHHGDEDTLNARGAIDLVARAVTAAEERLRPMLGLSVLIERNGDGARAEIRIDDQLVYVTAPPLQNFRLTKRGLS